MPQSLPIEVAVAVRQQLPDQLGHYRILSQLGEGGMGAVFLAEDTQLNCRLALKVPHFRATDDPKGIERFLREARLAQSIHHPYVCPIYDVGQVDGLHYLTMPLIEGAPLHRLIGPGKVWPQRRAADLVRRLALALHALHQRQVIHRDLKPHNIMVRGNDEPMLMDFGLARPLGTDVARLTSTGQAVGTPAYMPPELINGDAAALGPATDVYSLGVILYEVLTGRCPFEAGNLMALFYRVLHEAPPSLRSLRPDLDPELEAICLHTLAKQPGDRPASMTDLAAALGAYLGSKAEAIPETIAPAPPSVGVEHSPVDMRGACPHCGRKLEVPAAMWGKTARCAHCQGRFRVSEELRDVTARTLPQGSNISLLPREPLQEFVNSIGMKLALIPAGKFLMGSPASEAERSGDEGPQHEVEITKPFYLGIHPVTQEQYATVMGKNPAHFTKDEGGGPSHPVEQVSWEDAVEFCHKLSEKPEEKRLGRMYRLPTEAEWEYACRGGAPSARPVHFGDSLSSAQANFNGNYPYGGESKGQYLERTTAVGSYKANAFGLFDMHGNVWEWCADWFRDYPRKSLKDPAGPATGTHRVLRGGSWSYFGHDCRSAFRDYDDPGYRSHSVGFRVVCSPRRTDGGKMVSSKG